MNIQEILFSMSDEKIKNFNAKLIPNLPKENFIGIRTPELRKFAKKLQKENPDVAENFIKELPHKYFDENQLHGFLLEGIKDYKTCISKLEEFLPYMDNWATCDSCSPKILKKFPKETHKKAIKWIKSKHTYTIRYGIGVLMTNFLDEEYNKSDLDIVAGVKSDEYYVNMMIAWYFSYALVKHYHDAVVYLEKNVFDNFVHRKTIQKAVESYRISDDKKLYLKSLRK